MDVEIQWTNVSYSESNEELAIYMEEYPYNSYSFDATGGYMLIGDGSPDWGSINGTISFWVKWDNVADRPWGQNQDMEFRISGSNLVLDWGGTTLTSNTNFNSGVWYFIAVVWNEISNDLYLYVGDENNPPTLDASDLGWTGTVSTLGVTENDFMASRGGVDPLDGHGEDLRYWDIDRSLAQIQSDYDTELTGSETNLRSYYKLNNDFNDVGPNNDDGTGSGSYSFSSDVPFGSDEDLQVDVWYGGSWQNLIASLSSGWNNVSVSSYLDSSTFTIRFKGTDEVGDSDQNSWDIDVSLLHVWIPSDQYIAEVEFTGESNLEPWSEFEWLIDSNWDIGAVPVTIQFYNYSMGDWASTGNGYFSYTSNSTPGTDELIKQTILVNPTNFRNSTGHWKVKIKGEENTFSQFQLNVDTIQIKPIYPTAGSSIEFDTWYEYRIEAVTADGDPLSYGIASIFGNGTSLVLRDSVTKNPISNPDWVYLDIDGRYILEIKSINASSETFYIRTVVGSIIDEKSIAQLEP
jgi:hypothetical protein